MNLAQNTSIHDKIWQEFIFNPSAYTHQSWLNTIVGDDKILYFSYRRFLGTAQFNQIIIKKLGLQLPNKLSVNADIFHQMALLSPEICFKICLKLGLVANYCAVIKIIDGTKLREIMQIMGDNFQTMLNQYQDSAPKNGAWHNINHAAHQGYLIWAANIQDAYFTQRLALKLPKFSDNIYDETPVLDIDLTIKIMENAQKLWGQN